MNYPTVILENVDAISSVDCSDDAVTVTFNNTASYLATTTEWYADGDFVVITNHLGDCDAEVERGFFLVESLSWDNATLAVTASASKSNITQTAGMFNFLLLLRLALRNHQTKHIAGVAEVLFGNVGSSTLSKRTTWDPSYTISQDLALPANDVLYTLTDYLEVTADEVSLDTNVTFSGYLKYNFWTFDLQDLYFDVNVDSTLDIALTAEVLAAYSTTFTYSPNTLSTTVVSVPGILTIGPALTFLATTAISADSPVDLTVNTTVSLNDATVHLDLQNQDNTYATNWNPDYKVTAELSGKAEASLDPSASLTVEIQIEFLSGLVDLSSGLTATPGFTNTFTLSADEVATVENGTITATSISSGGSCADGLEVASNFTFGLTGFLTSYWSFDLYEVTVPIGDECWTWV